MVNTINPADVQPGEVWSVDPPEGRDGEWIGVRHAPSGREPWRLCCTVHIGLYYASDAAVVLRHRLVPATEGQLAREQWKTWEHKADEWKARAEALEAEAEESFEQGATWQKARTAPAVTRDDIEKVIDETLEKLVHGDWIPTAAADAVWSLVSGDDPAVHVVRESDLPVARVDGDYYAIAGPRGDHKWPQYESSWWVDRAQDALAEAARCTALARLAAREADVDPVEAKAEEFYDVAYPDDPDGWTHQADMHRDPFRRLAAHVLGQEASSDE